jgi:MFS family permease
MSHKKETTQVRDEDHARDANVNYWASALNQILLRVGWVFKTETVIMPGFLDILSDGKASLRGWLPVLARLGQSLPQFFYARRVRAMPRQKMAFFYMSLLQALPWLTLTGVILYLPQARPMWLSALFLILYGLFWVGGGVAVLLSGILQGKLIPVRRRGSLLAVSSFWGCGLGIVAIIFLLPAWLAQGRHGYALTFSAVAFFFALSALCILFFREPADTPASKDAPIGQFVAQSFRLLRQDKNFLRLINIITLYGTVWILFPHYATFARARLSVGHEFDYLWIAAQNAMNGLSSLIIGPIADRRGNRIALCVLTVVAGVTPLLAIGLSHLPTSLGAHLYWTVFALLGFTPVSQRIITNYTLEICAREQHAQYLGTVQLFQGVTQLFAPVVGWLMEQFQFEPIFLIASALIFWGGLVAQGLIEPRSKNLPSYEA